MQTPPPETDTTWLLSTIVILGGILALLVNYIIWKGRSPKGDHIFRTSRLTKGNRVFPVYFVVSQTSVTKTQPQWVGKNEESVHIAHISSIEVDTDVIWSTLHIETSGHNPMICRGLRKGDAVKLKQMIERLQLEHFKGGGRA